MILCLSLLFFSYAGIAQESKVNVSYSNDTAMVNKLLLQSKSFFQEDQDRALSIAKQAQDLSEKIDFPTGSAYALKNIGIVYYLQGRYLEALDNYHQSLKIFQDIKDNIGIANLYNNIGVIYYEQGDNAKALENDLLSLKYAELAGDRLRILTALNNVGSVYYIKPATRQKALEYYLKALPLCEELGNKNALGAIAVNIGSIYAAQNNPEKAMFYFNKSLNAYGNSDGSQNAYLSIGKLYLNQGKYPQALSNIEEALSISRKLNSNISLVQTLTVLGNLYTNKKEFTTAVQYYNQAKALADSMPPNDDLKDLYKAMAIAYEQSSDFRNAFKYQTLYSSIKDSIYNIATDKKLASLQFDFDLQKKEGQIALLTKDNALNELQIKKQKFARNALGSGLLLIFLIALLIYRNYRAKVKTTKILDRQKDEIEHLLLNILPSEVAKELQERGHSTPREYDSVSVLFTDFKGFTRLTSNMEPHILVEELNACFMAFDDIIGKYNLEKIKTIGDSYMCAGGIPTPDDDHTYNIIRAGLEIQEYIIRNNEKKRENGEEPWDLRIGIHVGPLVAGVVGKKKYAYDIWGATVNVASRMESNGAPEKVNISAATYELVKDHYSCTYRGKINAKNIGEIDMYFVDGIKDVSSKDFTVAEDADGINILQN